MTEKSTFDKPGTFAPGNDTTPSYTENQPPYGIEFHRKLELMGQSYFETDLSGKLTFFNDYACKLLGRCAEELKQLHYRALMTSDEARRVTHIYNYVYKTGIPSDIFQYDIIRKNGSLATVETVVSLLRDTAGKPVGFFGITRDVTNKRQTEKALRESEKKHRGIIENIAEGYYETDIHGNFTFINEAGCRNLGCTPDELTSVSYRKFMTPETAEKTFHMFNRVYQTGITEKIYQCEIIKKDGQKRINEISVSPLPGEIGKPVGFFGISRDRTEFQKMEERLRDNEESYRQIMACAPYSISIIRQSDLRYVEVNDVFTHRTGYSAEEIIGRTTAELNLYADPADRAEIVGILATGGILNQRETLFVSKSGEIIETIISARTIRFRGEDCYLIMSSEITALKETQRALAKSEEKYRNILASMEEGYYETDLGGNFTFVNNAMGKIHGYPSDELPGTNNRIYPVADDVKIINETFNQVSKTGVPVKDVDYTVIRKDGSRGVVETSASLLKCSNGEPIGFYGISRDITARRQAEKELMRYGEQLEKMVQERTHELEKAQKEIVKREKLAVLGQLTATVSHELRNPLGVIRSSNYYLQTNVVHTNPKMDKHFRRIETQVALCDTIVNDLLEYTRGSTIATVTEDINAWLAKLIDQHGEQGNLITNRLTSGLPPISHDREKMQRVIINILNNAIQAVAARQDVMARKQAPYTPQILVSTVLDGDFLCITIEDNGVGMNQTTLKQAFEPLFTTRARGTGIGLAIVQKIILEHNGSIDLKSSLEKGTRVTILLPLVKDDDAQK